MMKKTINAAVAVSIFLILTCCGGGGSATSGVPLQKQATMTFSVYSAPHTATLQGVGLTINPPVGVSVTSSTCSMIYFGGFPLDPVFDSVNRTVKIAVASGSDPLKFGNFAALTCDLVSGSTLQPADIESRSILSTIDLYSFSSVSLKDQLAVTVKASIDNK